MNDKNINNGEIKAGGNVHLGDKNEVHFHNNEHHITPKYLTGTIPTIAQGDIVGRETELEALEQLLGDSEKVVLVNGLGGIGKTTVARRYLTLHQDKFDHIAFVEVLSDDAQVNNSFIATLVNHAVLFQNLNVPFDLEQSEQQRFAAVLSSLQNLDGNNLLLIDNAGRQLESQVNQLPGKPQWQVLVTSREKLEGFKLYPLDTLSLEKAKELFKLHAGAVDDQELETLLEYIGCHTLTTELLAKTFKKSLTLKSPSQLLELLKNNQLDHKKLAKKIVSPHALGTEITLYTHLITAFTLAGLEATEIWLLKQFTVMPPQPMKSEFVLEVLQATEENEEHIADALQSLLQKGWIQEPKNRQYQIHRMVQEVIGYQEEITIEDCESLIKGVTKLLGIDQAKDNPIDKFQWVPFGDRLLLHFSAEKQSSISRLENNLATVYKELGSYEKAAQLLEKALKSYQQNFGDNHPNTARSMSNLATVYKALGSYEKAASLLEKALKSDQKNFGDNHPETAKKMSNLALVYIDLGSYEKAAQLLEKALKSDQQNLGDNHSETAKKMSNLALVYIDLGSYEKAAQLLEKALKPYQQNFGDNHPNTAAVMSNLASVYQALGSYEKAAQLLEKALKSDQQNFGDNHPETARSMSNLATVYQALGSYEKAAELLEKALKSDQQNFGDNHPETAKKMSNLALVYIDLGSYEKAAQLLEKALKSAEQNLGDNHPNTATVMLNLGTVYLDLKTPEKARSLISKAYSIYLNSLGAEHPTTKNCKSWLDDLEGELAK